MKNCFQFILFVFFHRKKMFVFNNVLSFSLFVRLIGLMIFFVICFYMLRNLFCNQWPTNTIKNCFWYTLYFLENWKDLFFVNDIIYITFFLKQKKRCSFETLGWFLVRKKNTKVLDFFFQNYISNIVLERYSPTICIYIAKNDSFTRFEF